MVLLKAVLLHKCKSCGISGQVLRPISLFLEVMKKSFAGGVDISEVSGRHLFQQWSSQ